MRRLRQEDCYEFELAWATQWDPVSIKLGLLGLYRDQAEGYTYSLKLTHFKNTAHSATQFASLKSGSCPQMYTGNARTGLCTRTVVAVLFGISFVTGLIAHPGEASRVPKGKAMGMDSKGP